MSSLFLDHLNEPSHSRMMDEVIKLERRQNESRGVYFWESRSLLSVTHRPFRQSIEADVPNLWLNDFNLTRLSLRLLSLFFWSFFLKLIERLKACHVMKEQLHSLSSLITGAVRLHPRLTQTNRAALTSNNNTQRLFKMHITAKYVLYTLGLI